MSKKIITISHIDNSGSIAYNGFSFQLACVFASFLKLSKTNENFYILLDYLDDFVIVDNPDSDNETITFVQVKSQKGRAITLHTVVAKEWILKQAKNYESFINDSVKNILLTNLGISVKSKVFDSITLTPVTSLGNDDDLKELKDQIFGKTSITDLDNFYILRSSISIDSYESELKGKMQEYANKNGLTSLTVEAMETIYIKIWNDLDRKQRCVLSDEDKKDYSVILDKKGMKYSRIKDIFRTALDVQLPPSGAISDFCRNNSLEIGALSSIEFAQLFREFRVEAVKNGMTVLEECWTYLRDNKDEIDMSGEILSVSNSIIDCLNRNCIVNSSAFYHKYKYCISTFFTYKLMQF